MPALEVPPPIDDVKELSETASFQSTPTNTPTRSRALQQRFLQQISSPRFSSRSSVISSTTRARRFDERIQSRFSALAQAHRYGDADVDVDVDDEGVGSSKWDACGATLLNTQVKDLKWIQLNTLNTLIRTSQSQQVYGAPTCLAAGDIVALGMSKGYVLIFDYRQILVMVLGEGTGASTWGKVTCLSLSLDSTHIAAGYDSGDVLVWDLKDSTRPKYHIAPLADISAITDGHIKGSPINNITFVGKRHSVLTTTDIYGMVMYHQRNRGVLGFAVTTRRILGRYEDVELMKPTTALDCKSLPLGSSVEPMDEQGLVAIMNTNSLLIVSTTGSIRTQFKTGRPKVINDGFGKSGCLSWYPAVVTKGGTRLPAKLAYCFNNVLTVMEVCTVGEHLSFDSKKRWVSDELIVGVQWVNQSVIAMVSNTQRLTLMIEATMQVTATVDLLPKHLFSLNLYSHSFAHAELCDTFGGSFKAYKGKLFFVGKYDILIGSVPSWVDVLLDLVNEGKYIKAIKVATMYYIGDESFVTLGLPKDAKERQQAVLKYLIDLVKASATHVLKSDLVNIHDSELVTEFLHVAINALISIKAESVVFEELYDVFSGDHVDYFFEALEPFILNGSCKVLTPTILKDMVKYYVSVRKVETLEQNICLLDIKSLDIDFTLSLLKKNNLKDSYTFIWNVLLHDYVTPFLDLLDEVKLGTDDSYKAFAYLAYILTGRQYPTEDMIPEPESTEAKLSLYFVLFNGLPVEHANGKVTVASTVTDDIAFPYLHLLASFDSKSFLSSMNECLEDSLLNDDEIVHQENKLKVNRQFIFQVLIELFSMKDFSQDDRVNFAIFVARNYPKFHQFIRLSEWTLQDTLQTLCSNDIDDDGVKEDCELSLQSLLSVYQPPNRNELLDVFEKSQFNDVLISMYLNDHRYSKVLEVWLRLDKSNSIDTTDGVLEKCFRSTEHNSKERTLLEQVVETNFPDIIEFDTFKIVNILNKYAPRLHPLCLRLSDNQLKFLYLQSLVQLESYGDFNLNVQERSEYVKCLGLFEKSSLLSYLKTINKGDIDLDACVSSLHENGCIEAIVYLLSREGKLRESLDEVVSYMEELLNKLPDAVQKSNKEDLDLIEADLWEQLQCGITLANHEGSQTQTTGSSKLSLNEEMWLSLMNFVVHKLRTFDREGQSPRTLEIIKRLLQDLFTTLINTRTQISTIQMDAQDVKRTHSSFLKIFTEFLHSNSSIGVTVLGDVRFVTREIYLALSYEKSIFTITARLISDTIYQNMALLTEQNLCGWSVINFECDACGKIIWGRHLNSEYYLAWEKALRASDDQHRDAVDKDHDLVSFNCRHCYHRSCLENLGNRGGYHCIICADKREAPQSTRT